MKILLTGATGFLGSHLLRALVSERYRVTVLKRSTSSLHRIADVVSQIHMFNVDENSVDDVFSNSPFDVVIHCATSYGRRGRQAKSVLEGNLLFPITLLDAAIANQCPYFINTDTFFCKQLPARLIHHEYLYMPDYTLSKYQFKEWGKLRASEGSITFINLQLEHVYGPDDSSGKFIPWLEEQFRNKSKSVALTDGIQLRDFVYVKDVVKVYLRVLSQLKSFDGYQSFEVGTGEAIPLRTFVENMKEKMGALTELHFGEIPRCKQEIMYSAASSSSPYLVGDSDEGEK